MSLIIDGYNLLNAAGSGGQWETQQSFEQDRLALLESLRAVIDPPELSRTTVVFDSRLSLPHLPKVFHHREIEVRFSHGYADADELIERMILEHTSPRRLMVVSSDHRIQRAARRRKASTMDSDAWFRWMRRRRQERQDWEAADTKPAPAVPEREVAEWLEFFGDIDPAELKTWPTDARWQSPDQGEPPPEEVAQRPGPSDSPDRDAAEPDAEKPTDSDGQPFSEEYLQRIVNEFFGPKPKQ